MAVRCCHCGSKTQQPSSSSSSFSPPPGRGGGGSGGCGKPRSVVAAAPCDRASMYQVMYEQSKAQCRSLAGKLGEAETALRALHERHERARLRGRRDAACREAAACLDVLKAELLDTLAELTAGAAAADGAAAVAAAARRAARRVKALPVQPPTTTDEEAAAAAAAAAQQLRALREERARADAAEAGRARHRALLRRYREALRASRAEARSAARQNGRLVALLRAAAAEEEEEEAGGGGGWRAAWVAAAPPQAGGGGVEEDEDEDELAALAAEVEGGVGRALEEEVEEGEVVLDLAVGAAGSLHVAAAAATEEAAGGGEEDDEAPPQPSKRPPAPAGATRFVSSTEEAGAGGVAGGARRGVSFAPTQGRRGRGEREGVLPPRQKTKVSTGRGGGGGGGGVGLRQPSGCGASQPSISDDLLQVWAGLVRFACVLIARVTKLEAKTRSNSNHTDRAGAGTAAAIAAELDFFVVACIVCLHTPASPRGMHEKEEIQKE